MSEENELVLRSMNPHSDECEYAVIGSMLSLPVIINDVQSLVSDEDFFNPIARIIFNVMVNMNANKYPIDSVSLVEALERKGSMAYVGGAASIAKLMANYYSFPHVKQHCMKLLEYTKRRKINVILLQSYDDMALKKQSDDIIDGMRNKLNLIDIDYEDSDIAQTIFDATLKETERLGDVQHKGYSGIPTGFQSIDDFIIGFEPTWYCVWGARPSMGKTTLAINMALSIVKRGIPVAFFSLEMAACELALKYISIRTRMDSGALRKGSNPPNKWPKIQSVLDECQDYPLYINDTPGLTIERMRKIIISYIKQYKVRVIWIDHMSLISTKERFKSEHNKFTYISHFIKNMAKELKITINVIHQLNRSVESRNNKRPALSDLRESGTVEEDCDFCGMLYRDEYYNPDTADKGITEIIINKFRFGRTGVAKLFFRKEHGEFVSLETHRAVMGATSYVERSAVD